MPPHSAFAQPKTPLRTLLARVLPPVLRRSTG